MEAAEKSGHASMTFPLSISLYQSGRLLGLGWPLRIQVRPRFIGVIYWAYGFLETFNFQVA